MKTLPINLKTFNFVGREYTNGKRVKNKCGRDFLYYSLHYYFPDKFNKNINNPLLIDKNKIFGFSANANLSWLMIQFLKVPKLFKELGLSLSINSKHVKTFTDFAVAMINPHKKSAEKAIQEVEKAVNAGFVAGVDISLGIFGLLDHVIFVYGYDEDNFYVFDTYEVSELEYEKITEDNRYIMKISKDVIKKRWTRFGRVWLIRKAF
ncbi:hypothetical protein HYW72_00080 [Candidatus Nomurabacteria bacterium]|nr:hypothetical protein [Candidatus Nomurabacteria bacterium]